MQFALMDGGAFVAVQELDRIFDGDDVVVLLAVDAVEEHSERGGFARSGGSGDENDAVAQLGDIGEVGGQAKRYEIRNSSGDDAHHDGATAALDEDVDSKTRNTGEAIGNVARSGFAQGCDCLFVIADEIGSDVAGIIGG